MSEDDDWSAAHAWYVFCVKRREHYERRNEPLAGLFYHAMRFWMRRPGVQTVDPTTDEGLQEVGEYIDFKLQSLPERYSQRPPLRRQSAYEFLDRRERNRRKRQRRAKR